VVTGEVSNEHKSKTRRLRGDQAMNIPPTQSRKESSMGAPQRRAGAPRKSPPWGKTVRMKPIVVASHPQKPAWATTHHAVVIVSPCR
jgi:hypothetical protein